MDNRGWGLKFTNLIERKNFRINSAFLSIILSCVFFENGCFAGRSSSREEGCFSRPLKKIRRKIKGVFESCFRRRTPYQYQRLSEYENLELGVLEEERTEDIDHPPLVNLSNEVLYNIVIFLPPPSVINLVKSNKRFSCLGSPEFWKIYNSFQKYVPWDEETPAIKIAFSYFWFRSNKVYRASRLGLPIAKCFIKKQREIQNSNLGRQGATNTYKSGFQSYVSTKYELKLYWALSKMSCNAVVE